MKKSLLILAVICLFSGAAAAQTPGAVMSDSSRRIIELPVTGSTNYLFKGSGSLFYPTSIAVTFPSGAQSNTVSISAIRNTVTIPLIEYTYSGASFIWYVPEAFYLTGGDRLVFSNTCTSNAIVTINLQF